MTEISQAIEGGDACPGKGTMGGGTSHITQGAQGLSRAGITENSRRWPGLHVHWFEKHIPVIVTGFSNSHQILAFGILCNWSSEFSHELSFTE